MAKISNKNLNLSDSYSRYEKIFKMSDFISSKFFHHYKAIFSSCSVELDDLKQEAYIIVLSTIAKYEPLNKKDIEISKLAKKGIIWRMTDLRDYAKRQVDTIKKEVVKNNENNSEITETEDEINYNLEFTDDMTCEIKDYNKQSFHFEELRSVLDDNEYTILYDVIKNKRTLQSIGEEKNCSREWIRQIYKRAITKSKKYLNIK